MKCAEGQTVSVPGNGRCEVIGRTGKSAPFILTVRRADGCVFDVDEAVICETGTPFSEQARMNLK